MLHPGHNVLIIKQLSFDKMPTYAKTTGKWKKNTSHNKRIKRFANSDLGKIMFPPRFLHLDKHFSFTNVNANGNWFFTLNVNDVAVDGNIDTAEGCVHGTYARLLQARRAMGQSATLDVATVGLDPARMIMWSKSVTNHTIYNPNTFVIQLDVMEWMPGPGLDSVGVAGPLTSINTFLQNTDIFPAAVAGVNAAHRNTLLSTVDTNAISTLEVERNFTLKSILPLMKNEWTLIRKKTTTLKPNQYITYFQKSFYGMVRNYDFGGPTVSFGSHFRPVTFKVVTPLGMSAGDPPKQGYSNAQIGYRINTSDIFRELPEGQVSHEVYKLVPPYDGGILFDADLAVLGTATTSLHIPHEGGVQLRVNVAEDNLGP